MAHISATGVSWLVIGGLMYSIGVFFYASKRIPFNHAIWHVFVLAGSACHYFAVLYAVVLLAKV
jgi:hemolysin III